MSEEDERNARHAEAMHALKAERDAMMQQKREGQGLLMVHTGDGKGKSTAAFGMLVRALGWGFKVGVVQYIKGKWITGERQFFRRFRTAAHHDRKCFLGERLCQRTGQRSQSVDLC